MGYIGIIDYGVGNLMSVINVLHYFGFDCKISASARVLEDADKLILPGVGAFPSAMAQLESKDLGPFVRKQAQKKPVLGICLGMQMLFEESSEIEDCKGLSLVKGKVRKIKTPLKLPHIGWNALDIKNASPLLKNVSDASFVYFVHSFCGVPENPEHIIASAEYGEDICAIVQSGYVFGCQFHPEKSGTTGLQIIKNFAEMNI